MGNARAQIGTVDELIHVVTEEDVRKFAEVTGDKNPVHMDEAYAKNTIFDGRIVHGAFGVGLISRLISEKLPGKGSILKSQSFRFTRPMRIGDTLKVTVEVMDTKPCVMPTRSVNVIACCYSLHTTVRNQNYDIVMHGEAEVLQ